jgi:hypothetical protein
MACGRAGPYTVFVDVQALPLLTVTYGKDVKILGGMISEKHQLYKNIYLR